jgi:hypothetical protein
MKNSLTAHAAECGASGKAVKPELVSLFFQI